MKIGVISAMQKEHAQIVQLLQQATAIDGTFPLVSGRLGDNELVLEQCGIGKVNAAVGAAELIRRMEVDCVVSTGVAGGADSSLSVMDVVVANRLVHHDFNIGMGYARGEIQGMPRFFPADEKLVSAALALGDPTVRAGLICTGDQFVSAAEDLAAIKQYFPNALAVDMESAAIAQTCYIYGVPFVSFRIISDTPGADKHVQQYENFWTDMAEKSFELTRKFLLSIK